MPTQSQHKKKRIAIVVSRFNEPIPTRLLDACREQLRKSGVRDSNIEVVRVPGAFEIPLAALHLAKHKDIGAVICLGAVIEGQTDHYRLVAQEAARGIMSVALQTGKPIIYEVLVCETIKLANERSGEKGFNKGRDAALAAVEMINILKTLS